MNNLLCRLGLHKWSQWNFYHSVSPFDTLTGMGYLVRHCKRCYWMQSHKMPVAIAEEECVDEPPV